jgi:hypothetical protein
MDVARFEARGSGKQASLPIPLRRPEANVLRERLFARFPGRGLSCGLHRIERLMRLQAVKARPRRHRLPPDLGERQVAAVAPTCSTAASKRSVSSAQRPLPNVRATWERQVLFVAAQGTAEATGQPVGALDARAKCAKCSAVPASMGRQEGPTVEDGKFSSTAGRMAGLGAPGPASCNPAKPAATPH